MPKIGRPRIKGTYQTTSSSLAKKRKQRRQKQAKADRAEKYRQAEKYEAALRSGETDRLRPSEAPTLKKSYETRQSGNLYPNQQGLLPGTSKPKPKLPPKISVDEYDKQRKRRRDLQEAEDKFGSEAVSAWKKAQKAPGSVPDTPETRREAMSVLGSTSAIDKWKGEQDFGETTQMAIPDLYGDGILSTYEDILRQEGGQVPFGEREKLKMQTEKLTQDMTPPMPTGSGQGDVVPSGGVMDEPTVRERRELEQRKLAEQQAQERYDELTQKYEEETDRTLQRFDKNAEVKYGNKLDQAEQNTRKTVEEMMRFKGAKGTARSSRTMDSIKTIREKGNDVKDAILEERDRERHILEMQLKGASGPALQAAAQALQKAKTERMGQEAVLQAAEQGLLLEQKALAQQQKQGRMEQYTKYLKDIGMTMDPITGKPVETLEAQLDKAEAANDMALAQKRTMEAAKLEDALNNPEHDIKFTVDETGKQVAVWYDPQVPGEMQVVDTGVMTDRGAAAGGGGGYGGGSYGGGSYGGDGAGGAGEDPDALVAMGQELARKTKDSEEALNWINRYPGGTAAKDAITASYYTAAREVIPSPSLQTALETGYPEGEIRTEQDILIFPGPKE